MAQDNHTTTLEFSFAAVVTPALSGGYVVLFPSLPGAVAAGETAEEARRMACDCLRAYLESIGRGRLPFPASDPPDFRTRHGERISVSIPLDAEASTSRREEPLHITR